MELTQQQTIVGSDPLKQRIQLFISCRKLKNLDILSKSDPQVEVYLKDRASPHWLKVGQTEMINNNLNPDFSNSIICDYYFEREQNIKFKVYDIDNASNNQKEFIGENETTIGKIFGSVQQTYVADLVAEKVTTSRGKIIIRLDNINTTSDEVRMHISAKLKPIMNLCCAGTNNPYYVISRQRQHGVNDYVRVYQSEPLFNNQAPMFPPQRIKTGLLFKDDKDLKIRFSFYSKNPQAVDILYGEGETSANSIIGGQKQLQLTKNNKIVGSVTFSQFLIVEVPNFMEYLRSGWAVNTSFAIDFTASNGTPSQPNSLHYQSSMQGSLNQYEQAILGVGKIVEPYALNQQYACFGFGCVPQVPGAPQAISHCFNMNHQLNPVISGLQNVFLSYKQVIKSVVLSGPTYFSYILKALLEYVKTCLTFQMYHCFIIITDGDIHDMQATIELICELSNYPVSIIIIGVGNDEFDKMTFLDSDNKVLRSASGVTASRDIVQFVRFQDYKSDIYLLAEEVLKEMPDQITSYMISKNIKPMKQEWKDINQFETL